MSLNTRPVLSSIPAFDADFGTSGKEYLSAPILKFSWKDGVVRKNRVVIRDYDTNENVYDCTIVTMALKHQLHNIFDTSDKTQLVTYKLKNGHKYIANVYVYTSDNEESLPSNDVIFYCYGAPTFEFTNFNNYLGDGKSTAIVNSSSINLTIRYTQTDGEPLNSYRFVLQDYNGSTLLISDTKYSSLSNDILRYTIGGIAETEEDKYGNIQENRAYKIICYGQTQHGIEISVEQKFVVKLISSGVGALIRAENVGDGTVSIYSNYKIMNAHCSAENPEYISDNDNQPYAINLSNGDFVEFIDGFMMNQPYEIIFKGQFKEGKLITLKNADEYFGYIALKKITYTTVPFYYFSLSIERENISYEIRTNYFVHNADLILAEIDLSYHDGLYNIRAKVNGQEGAIKNIYVPKGEIYTEDFINKIILNNKNTDETIATVKTAGGNVTGIRMYDHSANISNHVTDSFSSIANTNIDITDAEFVFTSVGLNNDYTIYNEKTGKYYANTTWDSPFFTDTETTKYVIGMNDNSETTFIINDSSNPYVSGRPLIFYTNEMNFNTGNYAPSSIMNMENIRCKLILLERNEQPGENDIIPGYRRAATITSGKKYLISYIWNSDDGDNGSVMVFYPGSDSANRTKLIKVIKKDILSIEGKNVGTTTTIVNCIIYNITVTDEIPVSEMTVQACSEIGSGTEGPASHVLDAVDVNPTSHWHSQSKEDDGCLNHWIQLNLNSVYLISSLRYLPRQDYPTAGNGIITGFVVQTSLTGKDEDWTNIAEGIWDYNDGSWKKVNLLQRKKPVMSVW